MDGMRLKVVRIALQADREVVLAAVKQNGLALEYADAALRGDREVVLAAVKQRGWALHYANEALRGDREVVLAAVKQGGRALKCADAALRGDREVVLTAVKQYGGALEYAAAALRGDREVVLAAIREVVHAAIKQEGCALEYADAALHADRDFMLAAVKQDGLALQYADAALRGDREVVLAAVKQNGQALQYADAALRTDRDFMVAAVRENGCALEYADATLRTDRHFMLVAVKQTKSVLQYADAAMRAMPAMGVSNAGGLSLGAIASHSNLIALHVFRNGSGKLGVTLSKHDDGVLAQHVHPGGPLQISGLLRNDVIVALNGMDLRGKPLKDVTARLIAAGELLTLVVRRRKAVPRNSKAIANTATAPKPPRRECLPEISNASHSDLIELHVLRNGSGKLGVTLLKHDDGALAQHVHPGGPLQIHGLLRDDVIVALDGTNLRGKTLEDVTARLIAAGELLTLVVRRRKAVPPNSSGGGGNTCADLEVFLASGLAAENARLKATLEAYKARESLSTSEFHSIRAALEAFKARESQSTSELHSLRAELKRFHEEVIVIDVETGKEEVAHVKGLALDPPAKRQRTTERAGAAFASHLADRVEVKKEKAKEAAGELEDAQDTLGYMVLSENNKMSEIDELKAEVERLNAENASLKAENASLKAASSSASTSSSRPCNRARTAELRIGDRIEIDAHRDANHPRRTHKPPTRGTKRKRAATAAASSSSSAAPPPPAAEAAPPADEDDYDNNCSVCFEPIRQDERVWLRCSHWFCAGCVRDAAKTTVATAQEEGGGGGDGLGRVSRQGVMVSCPMCRARVRVPMACE